MNALTDLVGKIPLDSNTIKFIAPLILKQIIPKVVRIGGKNVPTEGLVDKILADGRIGLEDIVILVAAWHDAPETAQAQLVPTISFPAPTPWKPPTGSGPVVPATAPTALSLVAGLGIEFELQDTIEKNRAPIGYSLTETSEAYEITLDPGYGTTNLPITAGAYLHAVYLDAQGVPINFEQRGTPELYTTAQWSARATDGSGLVTVGPGADVKMVTSGAHIANFREAEYNRTGGMDVPIHFPPEANEKVIDVTVSVGGISAKPVRFPKVS